MCGGGPGQDFGVDGSSLSLRQDGSVQGNLQVTPLGGWGSGAGGSWSSPVLRGRWSPEGQLSLVVLDQWELPIPVTITGKCDYSGLFTGTWAAALPPKAAPSPSVAMGGSASLAKSWSGAEGFANSTTAYVKGLCGPRWAPGAVPAVGRMSAGAAAAAASLSCRSGSNSGASGAAGAGSSAAQAPLLRPGPVWLRGAAVAATGGLQALRLEVQLLPGGGMTGRLGREAVPGPQHVAAALPRLAVDLTGGGWTPDGRLHFMHGQGLSEIMYEGICSETGEWLGEWRAARLEELPSAAVAAANEGTFRLAADALAAD
ncbi:hypothetical protein HYH02_000117 [Chlamydomonas schloesseri]|uniref:Uncharacterized protein n=1 Tax=Chlamydomonas schloesseri TaxID=2026947 RepID=A0A835WLM1_9CHLO|nr:hypothetical protein HYH02_000117 [Chlamydomonas schloesseri]|eukprot:KAG2450013.1 hypothetical protein HYH02_000117 [Chlamydomonas schloesseri]